MYLNLYKKHLSYILQFDAYVKNVSCISQEHLIAEDMKKKISQKHQGFLSWWILFT